MLGFISKRKHMDEIVKLGKSYRWEIEQAKRETQSMKAKHERLLHSMAKADLVPPPLGSLDRDIETVLVRLEFTRYVKHLPSEFARALAEHLTRTLLDHDRDYRPDMRMSEAQVMRARLHA